MNVRCLIATGVNAGGHREIPGADVTSSEDGAGWPAFLRGLAARGLSGVALAASDGHAGLVPAIASVLPSAAWQRCRTRSHRNLLARVPKSAQPWASTLVRAIFEQPGAASVRARHAQAVSAPEARLPGPPPTGTRPGTTSWPLPASRVRYGARSGPATRRNGSARRSGAAPASPASSRTAAPSSASPAPCPPGKTTNGPRHAAAWDRKYPPPAGKQRGKMKAMEQESPVMLN